jgi:thiamine monophosphate synthase
MALELVQLIIKNQMADQVQPRSESHMQAAAAAHRATMTHTLLAMMADHLDLAPAAQAAEVLGQTVIMDFHQAPVQ